MNNEEKLIEKYLGLIIKHFNLTKESVDSLKDKFDIQEQTKSRIAFTKKTETNFSMFTNELKRGAHLAIVEALKKYADSDAIERYMDEEGYQYEESREGTIENIIAQKFIVYPSENNEAVHNQLRRLSSYDFWEFEDIDGVIGYKIAYN